MVDDMVWGTYDESWRNMSFLSSNQDGEFDIDARIFALRIHPARYDHPAYSKIKET
jgi:hypothetical protein